MSKSFGERMSARIARNAKPREHNVRKDLDARVAAYGGVTRALAWLGRKGAPDVMVLFPTDSLFARTFPGRHRSPMVETKMAGDGVLSAAQIGEHKILRAAGQPVEVISTAAELDTWLPPLP